MASNSTIRPLGVDHVSVNVRDVEESIRFYCDHLGLSVRPDRPDLGIAGAWLDAGAQQVHLIQAEVPPGMGQHFSLLVGDIDAAVGALRAAGVGVSDPGSVGRNRQAFLQDPSGNAIEIHERG